MPRLRATLSDCDRTRLRRARATSRFRRGHPFGWCVACVVVATLVLPCAGGAARGDAADRGDVVLPPAPDAALAAPSSVPTFTQGGARVVVRQGPAIPPARDGESADSQLRRVARTLSETRVDLVLDEAKASDALAALAQAAGVPLNGRFVSERVTTGIDGDTLLLVRLVDVPLHEALEAVIDRCRTSSPATWQIVGGAIDVGPKSWLARSSARVTRVYDVQALLLEAPYFVPPTSTEAQPADIPITPLERWAERQGYQVRTKEGIRKPGILLAAELIDFVVTAVEPEAWRPSDKQVERQRERHPEQEGNADELGNPLVCHGQWASISFRAGHLMVTAPDYVHRALAGYDPSVRAR